MGKCQNSHFKSHANSVQNLPVAMHHNPVKQINTLESKFLRHEICFPEEICSLNCTTAQYGSGKMLKHEIDCHHAINV